MNRSLNPQLFDAPQSNNDSFTLVSDPRLPQTNVMSGGMQDRTSYNSIELKSLKADVTRIKSAMEQMERRTETIAFKMEELARTVEGRLERFGAMIARSEDQSSKLQQESAQRFAMMTAKVNERKIGESKIEALIDRHQSILRDFENRMSSLQRLASEQQMALHNSQAALDEARFEIARMKK